MNGVTFKDRLGLFDYLSATSIQNDLAMAQETLI